MLPLLNQIDEQEVWGVLKGEEGVKESSIFTRLQLYSSFRGQEWGSLQSKTREIWQGGTPLALLSICRQAVHFLWHRIAAVSRWRSFQSLRFLVLSWQQLLSRSFWNPFSHSVNAMHRKVGCSHQSPSFSQIWLIENREGCSTSMDFAYFPLTWQILDLIGKVWRAMNWKHFNSSEDKYTFYNKYLSLVANDNKVILLVL